MQLSADLWMQFIGTVLLRGKETKIEISSVELNPVLLKVTGIKPDLENVSGKLSKQ
jgi:hypothetical protein